MSYVRPLASRAAIYIFPPAVVLTVLFYFGEGNPSGVEGYWVGAVSSATVYTVFSCGSGSLAAAIEGSRVRRSRPLALAPVRSELRIAVMLLWPVVLMGLIVQATGFVLIAGPNLGSPGRFPIEVVGAWVAMILFHVSVGYLIGVALPMAASVPLALLVSYVWLGFTWSSSYIPLRYLSGLAISGCCAVYSDLASESTLSVSIFSAAGVLTVALLIQWHARQRRLKRMIGLLGCAIPITIGAILGLHVASGLGGYPSPPRDASKLSCERTLVAEICLFPEQLWKVSPNPVDTIDNALVNIRASGIRTPERVSAALPELNRKDTVVMLFRRDFTPVDTLHSLSTSFGYLDTERACSRDVHDPERPWIVSQAVGALVYYYATNGRTDPFISDVDVQRLVSEILESDRELQAEWVERARRALVDCETPFPDIPGQER